MIERESLTATESPEHRALAALGLFPFLDSAALNDEYAESRGDERSGRHPLWLLVGVIALSALVLIAASQTASNSTADAQQRRDLIRQLNERKSATNAVTASIKAAQAEINSLESGLSSNQQLSSSTRNRLGRWGTEAGISSVTGPGVEVIVNNAPASAGARGIVQDRDLQQLVNGLWQAGAEAIAINGQRISNLTAIRTAGAAITVNYQSLTPPYVIDAIGNSATLPANFAATPSGAAWLDLQQQLGMVFSMTTRSSVTLGAATLPVLRFAKVLVESGISGGSGP